MEDEEKEFIAFVTNLKVSDNDHFRLVETYRKRWGIETDNRVKNNFMVKTCTRNYALRVFFFLLAVLLRNLWVLVNLVSSPTIPKKPTIRVYMLKEHWRQSIKNSFRG